MGKHSPIRKVRPSPNGFPKDKGGLRIMKRYEKAELIIYLTQNEDIVTTSSLNAFTHTDAEYTNVDTFSGKTKFKLLT